MRKRALLHGLLAAPVGHLAVNAAGRAAHHSSNIADVLAHRGLQAGLTGGRLNPVSRFTLKALAGPESLSSYEAAEALGKKIAPLHTTEQQALIRAALAHPGGALAQAPIVGSLRNALQHELEGTAPTLQAQGAANKLFTGAVSGLSSIADKPFDTGAQRVARSVVAGAPLAAAAALDPVGLAAHGAVNLSRQGIAQSSVGKRVSKELFEKGVHGQSYSPAMERVIDYAVSPGVLDPMRIGRAVREEGGAPLYDFAKAHLPEAQVAKDKVQALLREAPTAAPRADLSRTIGAAPLEEALRTPAAVAPTSPTLNPALNRRVSIAPLSLPAAATAAPVTNAPAASSGAGRVLPYGAGRVLPYGAGLAAVGGLGYGAHRYYNRGAAPEPEMKAASASHRTVRGVLLDKAIPVVTPAKKNPLGSLRAAIDAASPGNWSHAQVAVPKEKVDLKALGFEKTRMAIPLPGETWFTPSYRAGSLHAHDAGKFYLVHEDASAPGSVAGVLRHAVDDVPPALLRRFLGKDAPFVQEKKAGKLVRNDVGSDEHRSATGGLTEAGRAYFARTEGAHLKPGVKEKHPTGEKARRKGSFLTRFFTHPRGPMQDEKGRPTRLALSAQAWGEPVPKNDEDAHRLAAKGQALLGKSKEASSEKHALFERLVRLGATDVPNTPRLLMRQRSPSELAQLQHGVDRAFSRFQEPAKARAEKAISRLPGKLQRFSRAAAHTLIDNPELVPLQAAPIPGLSPAYLGLKRGAEKLIDRAAPIAKEAQLQGGLAEKKHKTFADFPKASLDRGERVEHEHTRSHQLARSIAMDHLTEDPKYYEKLERIEKKAALWSAAEREWLRKTAAGAPTRGGFYMASDIPAYRAPSLTSAIQKNSGETSMPIEDKPKPKEKDSDMLGTYYPYGSGDFQRSKYAMPVEDMARFVAELRKEADVSPASSWNGLYFGTHRQQSDIPAFRAPRLDRAIQKTGAISSPKGQLSKSQHVGAPKVTAPSGPSIAAQVKPKGAHFGSGIPGAHKTKI